MGYWSDVDIAMNPPTPPQPPPIEATKARILASGLVPDPETNQPLLLLQLGDPTGKPMASLAFPIGDMRGVLLQLANVLVPPPISPIIQVAGPLPKLVL